MCAYSFGVEIRQWDDNTGNKINWRVCWNTVVCMHPWKFWLLRSGVMPSNFHFLWALQVILMSVECRLDLSIFSRMLWKYLIMPCLYLKKSFLTACKILPNTFWIKFNSLSWLLSSFTIPQTQGLRRITLGNAISHQGGRNTSHSLLRKHCSMLMWGGHILVLNRTQFSPPAPSDLLWIATCSPNSSPCVP